MNWKVTAFLASPLAGDAPQLDAILEWEMAQRLGLAHKIQRWEPCPPAGQVHLPCLRGTMGGVSGIPRVSSPIFLAEQDRHEHYAKRLAVEHAGLLHPSQRRVVAMGNSTYKAYRLPLRVRNVDCVCWFVGGYKRKHLKSLLDSVTSVGKKRSQGFGRIARWDFTEMEHDWSWFAQTEHGTLLMRPLPWCDQLPVDLIGFSRSYGGVVPPYWHPDRFCDCVMPA